MHIGIEADRANKKQRTGTEWYAFHLIQELKKLHSPHKFTLYSRDSLRDGLEDLPENFSHTLLPWKWKLWSQVRLTMHLFKERPDLLFIPSHTIPTICPCNIVTTLHDVGFKRFPELYSPIERWYHDWSAWYACKRAKKIITISEFSKKEILHFYHVSPEKIQVIPNGFQIATDSISESQRQQVLEKYGLHNPFILFIGRLEKKKNIERTVHAFQRVSKEIPNIDFVLVGKRGYGYENIQDAINQDIHIKELGWVDQKDIPVLYSQASIFLFPTLYEGFGIPILEAMQCETPVLTSKYGAHEEIAKDAALLVDPKEIDEIAIGLKTLLVNEELRQEFIQKGKKRAALYTYERCAKETYKVLESALAE